MTSYEVKRRHAVKTYSRYSITLRKDDDQELIALIENNKDKGIPPTETMRILYRNQK